MQIVISCLLTFITTTILNSLLNSVKKRIEKEKEHQQKDNTQHDALLCVLRSNITSKYYVYKKVGAVPAYEKENVNYMHQQYKIMGGNSYVDELVADFNMLPVEEI